ncbi:MAG TPA: AMP-binding protein, partial [Pseudomonadales bacterium]|nr:AMP-binding protein [Pseudomonadales bacterium]
AHTTTHYDLTLLADETDQGLRLALEYAEDLFDVSTIKRIGDQFIQLIHSMAQQENAPVCLLKLMTESEFKQITDRFNRKSASSAPSKFLHQQFEVHAQSHPDAIALAFEGQYMTYGELERRANQLAHALRGVGVAVEDRVALLLQRGFDVIIALLGVLKAGAAYVPIEPSYPKERIQYIFADANPRAVITQLSLNLFVPPDIPLVLLDAHQVCTEDSIQYLNAFPTTPISAVTLKKSNLAYVIYTSGSTGQPKGVMIEHAGLISLMSAMRAEFHFSSGDTWTLYHSIAFDFSVWEVWGALAHGGRLVLVSHDVARSSEAFHQLLLKESVTILNHTPSEFRYLLAPYIESREKPPVRYLFLGAESVDMQNLSSWIIANGLDWRQVVNLYGPTEATICSIFHRLTGEETAAIPIGKPVPDTDVLILD